MAGARGDELGDFLRARRSEITPVAVGLPTGGFRRVPGLRREEVAVLAAMSTDYYTRLEQGRIAASPSVLEALVRVLQLNEDQSAYVFDLALRCEQPPTARRGGRAPQQQQLQRILDDLTHIPAFVIGPRTEVVAWNAMAAALITDFGQIPPRDRYFLRLLVLDPEMRELYADWEGVTRLAISQVRMHNTRNPHDAALTRVVGELSLRDEDFKRWWASHDVAVRDSGSKHLRHPVVGNLQLDWNAMTWSADNRLQVVMWTAQAGTPSHDGLRLLGSWCAGTERPSATSSTRTLEP